MPLEYKGNGILEVFGLWNEASAEFDNNNNNKSGIMIDIRLHDSLDSRGKRFFIYRCRSVDSSPFASFTLNYYDESPSSPYHLVISSPVSSAANKEAYSLLLGKPAEFIHDDENPNIIHLGNADDLKKKHGGVIVRDPIDGSAVLYRQTTHNRSERF
ncbi:hypothetical protein O1611_g6678 [Lasiodiplodia mahajangana]|uniref:Uncharacterized protein n=1 Tax=Lasiodiplodia mahajangana TaxID=1108764 RepID=A0ACC2JHN4_9PEZI|nr:hypothetical protein O1611_g6678 [Lasiodiplodia mahajangana]